jgi:integrase
VAYIRKIIDKWQAQIERNGKRSSKTFATKREAQTWATAEEAKAKRDREDGAHTFGDAIDRYLKFVSSKKSSPAWERRRMEAFGEHFGRDTLLRDIQAPEIAAWRDQRLTGSDRAPGVSGSTVLREVNLLRNIFTVARDEWQWMDHFPFRGVKLPKEEAPRHQVWGWREIRRVLRAPRVGKTAEMQAAFHIALRTGMRMSEVLAAPENFDAKRRVVTLKTKTEARANIPIGRIASKLLARQRFTVGPNEGSVLFSKLCRELMIEGLTFHDTRGTALTHLAKKVDVLTLAKISRHRNINLLSTVYYRRTAEQIASEI